MKPEPINLTDIGKPQPTDIIVGSDVLTGDIGRDVFVVRHQFAVPETIWVADNMTVAEIVDLAFENPEFAALALVYVNGDELAREDWHQIPSMSDRVETFIPAQKGVARFFIKQAVQTIVFFITFVLTQSLVLAAQAASSIGSFVGNLLANALVPPASNDNGNIEAPKIYSIEGVRNRARPGEPFPLILGTRRVFPDIIVPAYQEIVGDDIYIRTGLCWAAHDIALAGFKIGETDIGNFDGVQIQHSLHTTDPTPTLIPGIPSPQSFAIDLADTTTWHSRTTAPDAEEIEIILFFPVGVGWLKKGKDKVIIDPPVGVEIRYRETGTGAWRVATAADTTQADAAAVGLGSLTRRDLLGDLGITFIDQFHTAIPTGNVSLTREWRRAAPGEPFPASIKFAVPPGKQYDVQVRRLNAPQGGDDFFEDITWTAMNTWRAGNPFPDAAAAVTAIRIKASDQLSGVVDTFNAVTQTLMPVYSPPIGGTANATAGDWSGSAASSNGADVLLFVTQGNHQTHPTPDAEINWPAFAEFWEWCDTQGFTFDYVENSARRKGDMQQLIGSACRARILRINGLLTPVIDRAQPAGNRTILTPDNAYNFVFQKSFPADIDALDVEFVNKDTDYRIDARTIYLDGQTAATAEKFERFNLPGVVTSDLIFRHARYFVKSSNLQILGGSCTQDLEGRMVLRFGDRVGIQHSTLALTSNSGFVREIFTNGSGDITGFRMSETSPVNTVDDFVARIRRIGTSGGEGTISAADVDSLTVSVDEETNTFTFTTPIPAVGGPEVGALVVVGIRHKEIIDGLVTNIEPLDDEGKSANISWTLYAPERFEEDVIPPHTPLTPGDLIPRPETPVIDSVVATNEGIFVGFTQPPKLGVVITGFAISLRETPAVGADGIWQDRPTLLPNARNFSLPAGRPGQSFDVRIVALGDAGIRSDPTVQSGIAAYDGVVAPTTPVVIPVGRTGPGGSRIPVISVAVDEVNDSLFDALLIETRTAAAPTWRTAATAPANNPVKDITGLAPGQTYDVRLAWKNIRGAITAEVDRPIITDIIVADDLIATDTGAVAGTPAATVVGDISTLGVDMSGLNAAVLRAGFRALPATFEDGGLYFTDQWNVAPDTARDATVSPITTATFKDDIAALQVTAGLEYISTKGRLPAVIGNTYKLRLRAYIDTLATNGNTRIFMRFRPFNDDDTYSGPVGSVTFVVGAVGWFDQEITYTVPGTATYSQLRGETIYNVGGGGTDAVQSLTVLALTDETRTIIVDDGVARAAAGLAANGDVARDIPGAVNIAGTSASVVASELQALVSGNREVGDLIISGVGSLKDILSTQTTNINTALADAATANGDLQLSVDFGQVSVTVEGGAQGTTNSVTVSVDGGVAPYFYSWSSVNLDPGIIINSTSAATTTFSGTPGVNNFLGGSARCTITDSTTPTAKTKTIDESVLIIDNTNFGGSGGGLEP